MTLKKIADLPKHETCTHPEHEPPTMIVLEPGVYEHECPGCHHKTTFTVRPMVWQARGRWPSPRWPSA